MLGSTGQPTQHFSISPSKMAKANLLDPILNSDTRLFIDPLLLSSSENKYISKQGYKLLRESFEKVVRLLDASRNEGDVAWRAAGKLLSLKERPETCLGYGGSSTGGSSRSEETREKVLRTATEIIRLGERDPEIISLVGMFEEGVGPDTISDIATAAIMSALGELTEAFCATIAVPTRRFPNYENRVLPENPFRPSTPVMLVPRDVLRDLPLAADWYDVSRVVMEIDEIRNFSTVRLAELFKPASAKRNKL